MIFAQDIFTFTELQTQQQYNNIQGRKKAYILTLILDVLAKTKKKETKNDDDKNISGSSSRTVHAHLFNLNMCELCVCVCENVFISCVVNFEHGKCQSLEKSASHPANIYDKNNTWEHSTVIHIYYEIYIHYWYIGTAMPVRTSNAHTIHVIIIIIIFCSQT